MNRNHDRLCPSAEWAEHMHTDVLPTVCAGASLGPRLLEIGPGPGATTDWLRRRADTLVAVEIEDAAALKLRERFAGTNVEVITGDATALPHSDGEFDAVACFTMLHHVPSAALQNAVLAQALRVLRPGGVLVAGDSIPSPSLHEFHVDDVYLPVDPASLVSRLQTIGFGALTLDVGHGWTVRAYKPETTA